MVMDDDIYVCIGWQIFSTGLRGFVVPVADVR
jgi:hypothetical protein